MTSRSWCFTVNNPLGPLDLSDKQIRYSVYQLEVGESGTRHYQGYLELVTSQRMSYIKGILPTAHLETRRGTRDQARAYCMKEDSRVEGPWESGEWISGQGSRQDLLCIRDLIKSGWPMREIAEEYFTTWVKNYRALDRYRLMVGDMRNWMTELHIIVGPSGTGKSKLAHELCPNAYWKPEGMYFDGYDGQEDIILDDFYGDISFKLLLNMADRYPLKVPFKGGFVNFIARRIIITSNVHYDRWYSQDTSALSRRITNLINLFPENLCDDI